MIFLFLVFNIFNVLLRVKWNGKEFVLFKYLLNSFIDIDIIYDVYEGMFVCLRLCNND